MGLIRAGKIESLDFEVGGVFDLGEDVVFLKSFEVDEGEVLELNEGLPQRHDPEHANPQEEGEDEFWP